jgi:hypothetical protein
LEHAAEVAKYAQMWRIADDHWDVWAGNHKKGESEFPFGVRDEFDRLAAWAPYVKAGNWPDADMLPDGSLTPHPGWGEPRQSRITQEEQRTEFTLFAMARSPLIYGGNLTKLDDFTRGLMTNKEVTEIDQKSVVSGPALTPKNDGDPLPWRAWYARTSGPQPKTYAAVFNVSDTAGTWDLAWIDFHLADKPHAVYDVWNQRHVVSAKTLHVEIPAHGCALFQVE